MDAINALIDTVNGWLYGYILVALLVAGGIYFTIRLQFLPTTLLKEARRTLASRGGRSSGAMSSFRRLPASSFSRARSSRRHSRGEGLKG